MLEYKNKEELCADYPNLMHDMIFRLVTRGKDNYEIDEEFGKKGFLTLTECLSFHFNHISYNVVKFITEGYEEDLYELPEQKELFKDNIIKLPYPKFEVWLHKIENDDAEKILCSSNESLAPDYFVVSGLRDYDWNYIYQNAWNDWIYYLDYPIEISDIGNGRMYIFSEEFGIHSIFKKERRYIKDCKEMKNIYEYFVELTNGFPDGEDYVEVNFELGGIIYEMSSKKMVRWEYATNKEQRYENLKKMVLNYNSNIKNIRITAIDMYR